MADFRELVDTGCKVTDVLIVEDDAELRGLLVRGLARAGFDVSAAGSAGQAMLEVERASPRALLIDIGLPDGDGRDLCRALRARGVQSPVLFLTARDALVDRLAGFDSGGDDYLIKPFAVSEVVARLQALLRRAAPAGRDALTIGGGLELDPATHEVCAGASVVALTPTEYRILAALAAAGAATSPRRALIRAAWPEGAVVHDNTLDVYVARLRRKLRELPDAPGILTVHGVGYRLR